MAEFDFIGDGVRNEGIVPVKTGITGENKIIYFGRRKNADGQFVQGQGQIIVKQANGATFSQIFFEVKSDPASEPYKWQSIALRDALSHICCKVLTKDEYISMANNAAGSFDRFFELMETQVSPKLTDARFNWFLKIVLRQNQKDGKWYPQLPKKISFLELQTEGKTTADTISNTLANGEFYEIPQVTAPVAATETPLFT
jgi:hypothetical protein